MGEPKKVQNASDLVLKADLDQSFLRLFEDLGTAALDGAAECTTAIFDLSSSYMDTPAIDSLRNFYDLYFSRGEIEQKKDEINANVSDMVDFLQDKLNSGENIDLGAGFNESDEIRRQRLSFSGVQKQMEGLITLDSGIRDQIIPALATMQFEDAIRQRMSHVVQAWAKMAESFGKDLSPQSLENLAKEIAKMLSSIEETKSFYELVLNEKPPEGGAQTSAFIEF